MGLHLARGGDAPYTPAPLTTIANIRLMGPVVFYLLSGRRLGRRVSGPARATVESVALGVKPMNGPAVLVVEDVPQIRATAVQLFQELGCEVFDAYNGHGALKILGAHPEIEVLFADIRMPGMSGTELVQVAQRLRPDLRIVLTSGYVSRDAVPDGGPGSRLPDP